jgi:hypothetical protein
VLDSRISWDRVVERNDEGLYNPIFRIVVAKDQEDNRAEKSSQKRRQSLAQILPPCQSCSWL